MLLPFDDAYFNKILKELREAQGVLDWTPYSEPVVKFLVINGSRFPLKSSESSYEKAVKGVRMATATFRSYLKMAPPSDSEIEPYIGELRNMGLIN